MLEKEARKKLITLGIHFPLLQIEFDIYIVSDNIKEAFKPQHL